MNNDTDGDGLTDGAENSLRIDPNNVDSDGDGTSDYDEVVKYRSKRLEQWEQFKTIGRRLECNNVTQVSSTYF